MSLGPFAWRGLVEGFYGPPYAHAERMAWIERLARLGMNAYVVAPKDDPHLRAEWRTPHPAAQQAEFAELAAAGERAGVAVGLAVSPGLDLRYADAADRSALLEKFQALAALGLRFPTLALDDVPSELAHESDRAAFGDLAAAQVDVANALRAALPARDPLWLVPTDYTGVAPSAYWVALGRGLAPGIEVAWTGRSVLPPTLRAEEARVRSAALGRKLLVWDNTPVSDGPMRRALHLSPYLGREPGLAAHCSGVLLNPMQHPRASFLAVACAARFLADPAGYDAERAFELAARELGAGAPEAFLRFARAHRFSPLEPAARDAELEPLFGALRDAEARRAPLEAPLAALRAAVVERVAVAETLRARLADRALAREIEPWLESHHVESRRMAAALDALAAVIAPGSPLERCLAFQRFEGALTLLPVPACVSYGPRRAFHPQLVSLRQEAAGFGADPALVRDGCLAEEVVRFAEDAALARLGAAPADPGAGAG